MPGTAMCAWWHQQVAEAVGVSRVTVHHHLSQSLEKINAYFSNNK